MKSVGAGILVVVLLVAGGCTTVERNPDDFPQTQTDVTPSSLVSAVEVAAPTSEWNSEELARVLLQAEGHRRPAGSPRVSF